MRRVVKLSVAALLSALTTVNVLAFMQARAMTTFVGGGERTGRPEQLSALDKVSVLLSGVSIPRPSNGRTPGDLNLSFEAHRFPNGEGETLEGWFLPGRNDRLLIALFHGYAASKSSLLGIARIFHQLGYAALLVDFYG